MVEALSDPPSSEELPHDKLQAEMRSLMRSHDWPPPPPATLYDGQACYMKPHANLSSHRVDTRDCEACARLCAYLSRGRGIFVHVPKNAGTSVERAFGVRRTCHVTAHAMRSCDVAAYDNALSFAVLRHPLERAISLYEYTRRGGDGSKRGRKKWKWVAYSNFSTFVYHLSTLSPQEQGHFAKQSTWLQQDGHGALLVDAILCSNDLTHGLAALQALEPSLPFEMINFQMPFASITAINTPSNSTTPQIEELPRLRTSHHTVQSVGLQTLSILERMYAQDYRLWWTHCNASTIA